MMSGTGHTQKFRQGSLFKTYWKHALNYGGILRKKRLGRSERPLSSKQPLHLVFKANKKAIRTGTLRSPYNRSIIARIIKKYSQKFGIKIEQFTVQFDHIHFLIRSTHRFRYQYFFRVIAGQIAQQLEKAGALNAVTNTPNCTQNCESSTGLWLLRPFTRVIKGYKAYAIVKNYVQLNEAEARGKIRYS